jgi:hypothetical protein
MRSMVEGACSVGPLGLAALATSPVNGGGSRYTAGTSVAVAARRGAVSSASISSIVRPRVSIAIKAKAIAPSTYQEAK